MSSRSRRRSSSSSSSSTVNCDDNITDDQITDLILNLQRLIPELRASPSHSHKQVSASKVLEETCKYIKKLHSQVDDLSDRLSQLLDSTDSNTPQAEIIRTLLM